MRRLRDIHVWLVGYDMVSLSLYHIEVLVLARFNTTVHIYNIILCNIDNICLDVAGVV